MGLFDKQQSTSQTNSTTDIHNDMNSIKTAANPQVSSATNPNLPTEPTSFNDSHQDQFVNPFANSNSTNSNQMPNASSVNVSNTASIDQSQMSSSTFPTQQQDPLMTNPSSIQLPNFDEQLANLPSQMSQFQNLGSQNVNDEMQSVINETIEKIIEEKWSELTQSVQKVVDWKDKVEDQVTLIKEDIVTMQEGFSMLEKRLVTKLNSYDKSILDVGSEIKALDKVFQKITPTLVNNVTELGRIAKDLKGISHTKHDE